MNCLERERLFGYASRLLDEPEMTQVRAHLEACPRCREIVESYAQVDAVLGEWKSVEPSAWFDARVRQAVQAQSAPSAARELWALRWVRGLALAALGVLVISGVLWFARSPHAVSRSSTVATRRPNPAAPAPVAPEEAQLKNPEVVTPRHPEKSVKPATVVNSAVAPTLDDEDAVTAEDDDLFANFDVLSELPKTETRIAN
jgi:anti-sigma factor RsiW